RHTRFSRDWSSAVCSSDLAAAPGGGQGGLPARRRRLGGGARRRGRASAARAGGAAGTRHRDREMNGARQGVHMRRYRSWAAVLVTLTALVAGCADPGVEPSASNAPASWPDPKSDLTGTTLTIWAAQNSNKVPEAVAAAFEKA